VAAYILTEHEHFGTSMWPYCKDHITWSRGALMPYPHIYSKEFSCAHHVSTVHHPVHAKVLAQGWKRIW